MEINIKNLGNCALPAYQTEWSAGADICANISENVVIEPLQRKLIPTGLSIELPAHYEAQIRPRSGLAYKHGITVLNSPGTIDADFRGEIKVLLINLGHENYEIKPGERIAQMLISPCIQAKWQIKEELNETARGEGGYGHTGK